MSSMSTIPGRRVQTDKTLKLPSLQSTDCRNKVCAERQVKFGGCIHFMNLLFRMPFAMVFLYAGKLIKIGSIYKYKPNKYNISCSDKWFTHLYYTNIKNIIIVTKFVYKLSSRKPPFTFDYAYLYNMLLLVCFIFYNMLKIIQFLQAFSV